MVGKFSIGGKKKKKVYKLYPYKDNCPVLDIKDTFHPYKCQEWLTALMIHEDTDLIPY